MTSDEIRAIIDKYPFITPDTQHMSEALRKQFRLRRTRKDRYTDKYSNGLFSLLLSDNGGMMAYAKGIGNGSAYGYKRVALCSGNTITDEILVRLLETHGMGIRQQPAEQVIGTTWSLLG